MDGISAVHIDQGHAKIKGCVSTSAIIDFIQSLGYSAVPETDSFVGIPQEQNNKKISSVSSKTIAKKVSSFRVTGMTCASCVATIESFLRNTEGVKSVSVGLLNERADVEYEPEVISPEQIAVKKSQAFLINQAAIEDVGFSASKLEIVEEGEIVLHIDGMTDFSCVERIEKALKALDGVTDAAVELIRQNCKIWYDSNKLGMNLNEISHRKQDPVR